MITKVNLEQAARAIALAFTADIPVAMWGPVGIGKSSIAAQVVNGLKWKLFDYRLSDKEPSDLGGIPFPKNGKLQYLMPPGLPFDTDDKCVLLLDEFDRAELSVQNVALQLVLDRQVNGHKLSPNARLLLAGNGVTDVGTTPLSKAAATRMCHLYIEGESDEALGSYLRWAEKNDVSPALRSFARYRKEVWCSSNGEQVEELALPTKRTFDMADKLIRVMNVVQFKTSDIRRALVAGCVGTAAATEFLAWIDLCKDAPTIEQIVEKPMVAKLPVDLGVYYALTMTLVDFADNVKATEKQIDGICQYATRWPDEQASYLFKRLIDAVPSVAAGKTYQDWNKKVRAL